MNPNYNAPPPPQLWRVFSPATQEAMPWCSGWESLAAGSLTCFLLNEIRAPAPGLDPFTGLDIPPIRHMPQPNCPLLALPPELLYNITDQLHFLPDILSLALTCNPFLSVCLQKLRVSLYDRMRGAWINTPLICLGSLTAVRADLPPQIQPLHDNIDLEKALDNSSSAYLLTYRPGSRRQTYYLFEKSHTLLKNYERLESNETLYGSIPISSEVRERNADRFPLDRILSTIPNLPNWTHRLVSRAVQLDNGTLRLYSPTANYVIRNLTKQQYLPFSAGGVLKGEIESVFFRSQIIPLDQAVTIVFLFLISWSSSIEGLEDEMVRKDATGVYGIWAGDCFDVCEAEQLDDGWKSVEDETLLSFRLFLPCMYRNMHGQNRWGEPNARTTTTSFSTFLY
ncbi:hypothetical protein TWF481_011020 [Arthrobotrys musiformis]|uniref:F-box domain-containing protein n=1 Tax=Arthrobotrys musiformis TaxID=47236 RepID=A0AAV9VX25_9PEZI